MYEFYLINIFLFLVFLFKNMDYFKIKWYDNIYNKKVIIEKGMHMNEFEININGVDKIAHIVTRLELENTDIEYIYYNVDDEKNDDGEYLLFASRIENTENGKEEIIELDNEDEKRIAFELFSHVYKNIQK